MRAFAFVEFKMLSLWFREFCSGGRAEGHSNAKKFDACLRDSSFPYTLRLPEGGAEVRRYLTDIYNTVLLKEVATRLWPVANKRGR